MKYVFFFIYLIFQTKNFIFFVLFYKQFVIIIGPIFMATNLTPPDPKKICKPKIPERQSLRPIVTIFPQGRCQGQV